MNEEKSIDELIEMLSELIEKHTTPSYVRSAERSL